MKKNLTELVFILDRSGSMADLVSDTIGGFNGLLRKQKEMDGDALVTTVLFDDHYELLHDRVSLAGVAFITEKDYYVRGMTALLDAVGRTIGKIDAAQSHTVESERPEHTLFVIVTDGMENASHEYTHDAVRKLIEARKADGWEFLFLGANIDAFSAARDIGIDMAHASNAMPDSIGTHAVYESMNDAVCCARATGSVPMGWNKKAQGDYEKRKK